MRAHTNLHLEARLNDWTANVLPWEIDMNIAEPEVDHADVVNGEEEAATAQA